MINEENAVEVRNIVKKFKVYHDKGNTLKDKALHFSRNKFETREVLKGISFDIKRGEAVGLIGHNGCGKSTLLKLLTRIMYPDSGEIKIKGRVSSLLELGAGFHPDMSGRQNIYINASIFGLSKKEIEGRLDDIIEFSELEEFIDNPVRTYSSGMYMRLAFSVAINVNADVLLIDEILAVGDVNFQTKCFNKLMEIKNNGTTIVLVSHSMDQIEQICGRSIWIHEGKIRKDGKPRDVHNEYLKYMGLARKNNITLSDQVEHEKKEQEATKKDKGVESKEKSLINPTENPEKFNHRGTGEIKVTGVTVLNAEGKVQKVFEHGDDIIIKVDYKVLKKMNDVYFGICIIKNDGHRCYGTNMSVENMPLLNITTSGSVMIEYPKIQLMQGVYCIDFHIGKGINETIDYVDSVGRFEVYQTTKEEGTFYLEHKWLK